MKKLILFSLLTFMFAAFTANTASAQLVVTNNKPCTFKIKVHYSNSNCTGFVVPVEYTVPGNSTFAIATNLRPYRITGAPIPIPFGCGSFDITHRCNGPVGIQNITCPGPCGPTYKVSLNNGAFKIF